ncbi:MAG: SDR family NAD(P)-dependent oxidoreductase [Solirubrobacteraceae bacterium]
MSVLVTGAAGEIGSEIVRRFVASGERVIAQDLAPALDGGLWPPARKSFGDLTDRSFLAELADVCDAEGVDRAVLAHGIDGAAPIRSLAERDLRRVVQVNASTVVQLTRSLVPVLAAREGVVVVVASQAGLRSEPNLAAYCAAKFALVGWARRLAPALADQGVRLRVACPGCTRTGLLESAFRRFAEAEGVTSAEALARRVRTIPVGRIAEPAESAAAVVYLAARAAARPTLLAVTGGEVLV